MGPSLSQKAFCHCPLHAELAAVQITSSTLARTAPAVTLACSLQLSTFSRCAVQDAEFGFTCLEQIYRHIV